MCTLQIVVCKCACNADDWKDLQTWSSAHVPSPKLDSPNYSHRQKPLGVLLISSIASKSSSTVSAIVGTCNSACREDKHGIGGDGKILLVRGLDNVVNDTWAQFASLALSAATPIIHAAQGLGDWGELNTIEPIVVGALVSRPGAGVQRFHCDAVQHHFAAAKAEKSQTKSVRAEDKSEGGDGTEFWPGPRLDDSLRTLAHRFLACETGSYPSPLNPADIHAPACKGGNDFLRLQGHTQRPPIDGP